MKKIIGNNKIDIVSKIIKKLSDRMPNIVDIATKIKNKLPGVMIADNIAVVI